MNYQKIKHAPLLFTLCFFTALSQASRLPTDSSHNAFFEHIRALCGQAFKGEVVVDKPTSNIFKSQKIIMHVRKCDNGQIQIPFHIGQNASRTWLLTKTDSGLSLKHDHRHHDGTPDDLTMYGGVSTGSGQDSIQSFPADEYSKQLFTKLSMTPSLENVWQMFIYPDSFSYRLVRQGREVRVDFDLTQPVPLPATPWGYPD